MIEKIFILHHTHVDMGYTTSRDEACDHLVSMIDHVTDIVETSGDRPEPEKFRWIHEVSWPVLEYIRRGGQNQEKVLRHIRDGRAELTALYVNPTELFDRKSFEVTIDYACQLAREHNLPLTTGMFTDVPGITWAMPDILAQRGIKYLSAGPNMMMGMPLEVERPFYWEGPDGGRVLTWFNDWRLAFYAEGLHFFKFHEDPVAATKRLLEYVEKLESEGYRWRGLAIHAAVDNWPPQPGIMNFVAHFNNCQSKIQATMATNNQFFKFMESEHSGEFEVHRKAWPNWWALDLGAMAYEVACSRQAKGSLRRSDALSSKFNLKKDEKLYRQAFEAMVIYDEHTWGDQPTATAPWSLPVRLQWSQSRTYIYNALYKAARLETQMLKQLGEKDSILMANPFDEDCTGVVCMPDSYPILLFAAEVSDSPADGEKKPVLEDLATGEKIAGQSCKASNTAARSGDYYVIKLKAGQVRQFKQAEAQVGKIARPKKMENDYFRIDYNKTTGDIRGVYDKSIGCDLYDGKAIWGFAELIHDRVASGGRKAFYDSSLGVTKPESRRPRPEFVYQGGHVSPQKSALIAGDVFNALVTRGQLPGVSFVREVRLYHTIKRIDILLRLDKQIITEYESLYLAFPFAAEPPTVWIETAGTVYRAGIDQLPGSATDWHSLTEYAAVSDNDKTIVLAPQDTPVVQVGDINTGKWSRRLEVKCGHIYSWVMDNMWYTNLPAYQEGQTELSWSMTAFKGTFNKKPADLFAGSTRVGIAYKDRFIGVIHPTLF